MLVHPLRCFAAAGAGNADGAAVLEPLQHGLVWNAKEEGSRYAIGGKGLHDVGRTGEIVAIITEKKFGHRSQASLPSLNFAIEAASSGWSLA